jgi:hypothetical protein
MHLRAFSCAPITRLGSRRRRLIKIERMNVDGGVPHRAPLSLLNEAPFAGSGGRGSRSGALDFPLKLRKLPRHCRTAQRFLLQPLNANAGETG